MNDLKWMILQGKADVNSEGIHYSGVNDQTTTALKCNHSFVGGEIRFVVSFEPLKTAKKPQKLFIGLNDGSDKPKLYIGCTSYGSYFIDQQTPSGWNRLDSTGEDLLNIDPVAVEVRVKVAGSSISLFANDVKVCQSTQAQLANAQITLAFEGKGAINATEFAVESTKLKAFIIMQFGQYDYIYSHVIKPICDKKDINCVRADEYHYPGSILKDIINSLVDSDIIVADITPDNPNVYFEVGYAYALGKNPILLMDRARESVPFDISGFRVIMYNNTIEGASKVKDQFDKYLSEFVR